MLDFALFTFQAILIMWANRTLPPAFSNALNNTLFGLRSFSVSAFLGSLAKDVGAVCTKAFSLQLLDDIERK